VQENKDRSGLYRQEEGKVKAGDGNGEKWYVMKNNKRRSNKTNNNGIKNKTKEQKKKAKTTRSSGRTNFQFLFDMTRAAQKTKKNRGHTDTARWSHESSNKN
jgi:hypothetical protein